jgi:hypothetical protein
MNLASQISMHVVTDVTPLTHGTDLTRHQPNGSLHFPRTFLCFAHLNLRALRRLGAGEG